MMNLYRMMLIGMAGFIFSGCQYKNDSSSNASDSSKTKAAIAYAFIPKSSLNWRPGDKSNAALVLDCLKKYVNGDVKACGAYFADTAAFMGDKFYFRGSRDSLISIITAMRGASVSVSKNFDSWVTLYNPDLDETKVTLWYTEVMTDRKGKVDSIYYTDDVLIKNAKIVSYDEKQRQF